MYSGRGTKYPNPDAGSGAVLAIVEATCDDVERNDVLQQQCKLQLAAHPTIPWYTVDMAVKHVRFMHAVLQPGFEVKESLVKLPDDVMSCVLLIINGYRM